VESRRSNTGRQPVATPYHASNMWSAFVPDLGVRLESTRMCEFETRISPMLDHLEKAHSLGNFSPQR